ncbi:monovalent cation/H(+) antiporter subunit G [Micromonospora matsumotoense]|uniref:monovalent cation/H(+) antiporter subunit G n=1 Tax=Micromonospora matsumotoense TaxID=121616 RepID=UPI003F541371
MGTVVDWLAAVALVSGALLSLAAGIGVLRFPDVLDRMHAATKPQVLGVLLLLVGLALRLRTAEDLGMIVLVGVFQLATAPVAAQMIGRAAYRSGRVDRSLLDVDELADHRPERDEQRRSDSRSGRGERRRGDSRSRRGEQRRGE